jgi:hypothetical protein
MNINNFTRGEKIPLIESGSYGGVCCGIVDLGSQHSVYQGKERHRGELLILFEIPDERIEINGEMKPRQMPRRFTKSVYETSTLRAFLKSWRGHDFTPEELADFDLKRMLGVPGLLNIVHNTSKQGNTYAYLDGVVKLVKGMSVGKAEVSHYFNIELEESWSTFAKLPQWVQEAINKSEECKYAPFVADEEGHVMRDRREPNATLVEEPDPDSAFQGNAPDNPFIEAKSATAETGIPAAPTSPDTLDDLDF